MRGTNPVHVVLMTSLLTILSAGSAFAQTDFSGEWTVVRSQDNTENPWVGDWFGLPLNAAGLARAESWDASILSLPEYQCRPHGWAYIYRGPAMRISKEVDPFSREVVAYHPEWHQSTDSPVFLDGREQPAEEAPHVWGGFSTAAWEGDILRIETTHLKEDYIRRNDAMVSDEATVTSWWIRRGDYLTWINIVHYVSTRTRGRKRAGSSSAAPNRRQESRRGRDIRWLAGTCPAEAADRPQRGAVN